jgi:hypothetical protein
VLDRLNVQGITMLAEIFMVRLEAAARVSQEKAAQSNSRFVPFTDNNQFIFKDSGEQACPTHLARTVPAMRSLSGSLAAALVTTGLAASFAASSANAQQPPREGCRAVSRLEYTSAKNENVIISKGGRYVRTGPFWRRHYWHFPV